MWKQLWESHSGRIIGVAAGIGLGFLYLFAGFWDMLFFALLVFIAYQIGKQKDLQLEPMFSWRRIVSWLSERWSRLR